MLSGANAARPLSFEKEVCIRAKGGNGAGNCRDLVPRYLICSVL